MISFLFSFYSDCVILYLCLTLRYRVIFDKNTLNANTTIPQALLITSHKLGVTFLILINSLPT